MAPLRPDEDPGWDDGPSRPGYGLRRTVIIAIVGLLLVTGPPAVLMLVGTAFPWLFQKEAAHVPSRITSSLKLSLTIAPDDWPRFVQAADKFAARQGLSDRIPDSTSPVSELRFIRYEGREAILGIYPSKRERPTPVISLNIDIHEIAGSGTGQALRTAFEKEVIQAGRFGERP